MTRRDEALTIRAELVDEFPDGIPSWMIDLPVDEVRRAMDLRRRGYEIFGMLAGDDAEDEDD